MGKVEFFAGAQTSGRWASPFLSELDSLHVELSVFQRAVEGEAS